MSAIFFQIQTGTDAVLTEEPTEKTMTILELMTSGGVGGILIMVTLGILSIFAVYIFLERFGAMRNANKVDPNFMNNINTILLVYHIHKTVRLWYYFAIFKPTSWMSTWSK